MNYSNVRIEVHVPHDHADAVRAAIAEAGGGVIGEYSHCSFTSEGVGRFMPSHKADPHIGSAGQVSSVDEQSIQIECSIGEARKIVAAIVDAHPYETPHVAISPILAVADLP